MLNQEVLFGFLIKIADDNFTSWFIETTADEFTLIKYDSLKQAQISRWL